MPAVVTLVLLLAVVTATPAGAHPVLLDADPGPGSVQQRRPPQLTLRFAGEVDTARSRVRLSAGEDGRPAPLVLVRSTGRMLQAELPALPAGLYVVRYEAGGTDGHIVTGEYRFVVWPAGSPAPAGLADLERRSSGVDEGAGRLRSAAVVCSLPLVGLVVMALAIGRGRRPRHLWHAIAVLGGQAAAADAAVVIAGRGVGSRFEWLTAAHGVAVVALLVVVLPAVVPRAGRRAGRRRDSVPRVSGAVGLLLLGPLALTSHDAALSSDPAMAAVDWLHLASGAFWVGGVVWLALRLIAGERDELSVEVRRFSRLAPAAVLVVVATGLVSARSRIPAWGDVTGSRYGLVLVAKVVLVGLALAWAVVNRRRVVRWTLTGEGLAVVAVLAAAGTLISLTPPVRPVRQVVAPVLASVVVGDRAYSVLISPATPGTNTARIRPLDGNADGEPPAASLLAGNDAPAALDLRPASSGWVGTFEIPEGPVRLRLAGPGSSGSHDLVLPSDPVRSSDRLDEVVSLNGPLADECRARLVGQMAAISDHNLAGHATSMSVVEGSDACESDADRARAASVGRIFGRFLADHQVRRVAIVGDDEPRTEAFASGFRAASASATEVTTVRPTDLDAARTWAPDAVVVAGGLSAAELVWSAAADSAWLPPRGIFLAPWLLDAAFLKTTIGDEGPQISLGLDFDPYGPAARGYLSSVARLAPFESPSASGVEGYVASARAMADAPALGDDPVEVTFFAVARVAFLPSPLDHGHDHHLWLDEGGLATISGTLQDPFS